MRLTSGRGRLQGKLPGGKHNGEALLEAVLGTIYMR